MSDSQQYEGTEALNKLHRAQKTLDQVEDKMKKFRTRKKQKEHDYVSKAPYPDLNKYFSFLENQQNQNLKEEIYSHPTYNPKEFRSEQQSKPKYYQSQKENTIMTINQKLEKEKNSSINKIQEYYMERNQALQERVKDLKEIKERLIKDQQILIKNNEELEGQIQLRRSNKEENNKINQLKLKIEHMKNKISNVQNQNCAINNRNRQYQKHIKETLRTHKANISQQLLMRPKSTSATRCHYH